MTIKKILIVDDSPTDLAFLSGVLQRNGYEVQQADSGEAALERLGRDRPDLILMDVVMPGRNGFEITRAITRGEATRDIPVVICTSKAQETDRIWGMRQGAKHYLTKPVSETDLVACLRQFG